MAYVGVHRPLGPCKVTMSIMPLKEYLVEEFVGGTKIDCLIFGSSPPSLPITLPLQWPSLE